MARPLRIQYPGAVYHITSRGNERRNIFLSDLDRRLFLRTLEEMIDEFRVICHAWVLMGNHYHLLLETPEPNISRAIHYLNGVYTQRFNRRKRRTGHLFQGRFKAILVQKDSHLLELCRYVVLNPVRARLCEKPGQWKWSSYLATAGLVRGEDWLETEWVLSQFGKVRVLKRRAYRNFVENGLALKKSPWEGAASRIHFGSEGFQKSLEHPAPEKDPEIPWAHKRPQRPDPEGVLSGVARTYGVEVGSILQKNHRANEPRDVAMFLLRRRAGLGLRNIAMRFGVGYKAVSQRVWIIQKRLELEPNLREKIGDR